MKQPSVAHGSLLRKEFLSVLVIVANAFSWYFPLYVFFENALMTYIANFSTLLTAFSIHYVGVIGSAFAGTFLVKKFSSRSTFLSFWMLIGVASSAMLVALDTSNVTYLLLVSFILGFSLGLGFPSCFAFFGDYTFEENRGRLGGITFFVSGLGMLLIGLTASMFQNFALRMLFFTFWRGIGLVLFLLVKPRQENRQNVEASFKSVLFDKSLALYLVPWIMFCLVNFLEMPMLRAHANSLFEADISPLFSIAEFGIGGFVALICGAFADSVGRKREVIFGFIVLGIAYAVLGLFPETFFSWYLLIVLDGVAWGIFSLVFYMVVWADLARDRIKEKYYLVGILPFLISSYIRILFTPHAELGDVSTAFSLASFFLFLAVLPLLYAPETLSEKEIEKKRLRKYLEDVKKVKRKHEK